MELADAAAAMIISQPWDKKRWITIVAVTRIPAAVTKITVVFCCWGAGRIHSEAQ